MLNYCPVDSVIADKLEKKSVSSAHVAPNFSSLLVWILLLSAIYSSKVTNPVREGNSPPIDVSL